MGTSVYSTVYTHDGFGRSSKSTQTTGSWGSPSLVYMYSAADMLATMQYPSGRTLIYTADSVGAGDMLYGKRHAGNDDVVDGSWTSDPFLRSRL